MCPPRTPTIPQCPPLYQVPHCPPASGPSVPTPASRHSTPGSQEGALRPGPCLLHPWHTQHPAQQLLHKHLLPGPARRPDAQQMLTSTPGIQFPREHWCQERLKKAGREAVTPRQARPRPRELRQGCCCSESNGTRAALPAGHMQGPDHTVCSHSD